nr:hypothetical protein BaRGS_006473 [Batillaria attramentaria]
MVQLTGRDTVDLLQGLVTSNVTELSNTTSTAQYSMMLNVQGRVLYDLILYNNSTAMEVCFLIECDDTVKEDFMKTVKRYKIRKKWGSNHNGNDAFKNHHTLRLFKSTATMTVGTGRREVLSAARDETDEGADNYQCPVCRNTAMCEHLKIIEDLQQDDFRKNENCPIPSHHDGKRLNAYCTVCNEPVCRNCSAIEHKDHNTINIENAGAEKLSYVQALKKGLDVRSEIFHEAAQSAKKAEVEFHHHIYEVQKAMVERKGRMQTEVEEAFNKAYTVIEETGQKVAELNRQISEMRAEERFLRAAVNLAELASSQGTRDVEIVRIWKGLDSLNESMGGETDKKHAKVADAVVPQEIKEKRLVLPAPNCMTPDLSILEKVGVEGRVLELSFRLKAEQELLSFYSILPLTQTEALVACQTEACKSAVVGYDNLRDKYSSVVLEREGQYCLVAVPGNGIVASHYQAAGACSTQTKHEVLFWDQALEFSMAELEKRGAGKDLKPFAETELPPRGIAVTRDNNLVVCTAEDKRGGSGEARRSCILLMTLKGDILKRTPPSVAMGRISEGDTYFPRYATVNINGDICVTDAVDRSVLILNGELREKLRIRNPYADEAKNKQFSPMGICHDSFGRLIVADPMNHAVIRFEVEDMGIVPVARPILEYRYGHAQDMWDPTLVALGPGPKLWVVCRSDIFVFDYMDKE